MTDRRPENEIDSALKHALDAAETPRPLRPMWPEVERRRARRARPVFDLRFSVASAAALSIGFLMGVLTFDGTTGTASVTGAPEAVATAEGSDWTEMGPTLDDLYLFDDANGREVSQ